MIIKKKDPYRCKTGITMIFVCKFERLVLGQRCQHTPLGFKIFPQGSMLPAKYV